MRPYLFQRRVRWYAADTIKFLADGNSITAGGQDGSGSIGGVMGQIFSGSAPVYPMSTQTYANVAIGGQTTTDMIANKTDVSSNWVTGKYNILFAQELTNSGNTGITAAENTQLFLDYLAAVRADRNWDLVIVATAPPAWLGASYTQAQINDYNARLDASNALLRSRFREQADALFETRQETSPYAQSRYPDYLQTTFSSTVVINGISNNAAWTNEGDGIRIHYSAAGIAKLKPLVADWLLRLRRR